MFFRAALGWFAILVLAIINGAIRQGVLIPRLGERVGHVISTLMLSGLVLVAAWLLTPWIRPVTRGDAWLVGALWVVLTVAFEFLGGHYLFGNTWEKLLADYNLAQGRIWILVLITTLVAPVVALLMRSSTRG
ncbi:MAG TPA: hypothetical protein VGM03_21945 [Phycisphaerae bacterium]|jgi:hypothetical protein